MAYTCIALYLVQRITHSPLHTFTPWCSHSCSGTVWQKRISQFFFRFWSWCFRRLIPENVWYSALFIPKLITVCLRSFIQLRPGFKHLNILKDQRHCRQWREIYINWPKGCQQENYLLLQNQCNQTGTCRFPHGQAKCLLEKKTEFHRQNKDRVFLATITNNCVIVESSETLKIKNREYTKKYRDRGLVCENVLLPIVQREQKIKKGRITSK